MAGKFFSTYASDQQDQEDSELAFMLLGCAASDADHS